MNKDGEFAESMTQISYFHIKTKSIFMACVLRREDRYIYYLGYIIPLIRI